jgi:hypothetical protein
MSEHHQDLFHTLARASNALRYRNTLDIWDISSSVNPKTWYPGTTANASSTPHIYTTLLERGSNL